MTRRSREVGRYFTRLAEAEGPADRQAAGVRRDAISSISCRAGWWAPRAVSSPRARLSHLEGAVIEELGRVREELGWPIVMTPFAQILMTQAVMNVMNRERYKVIPDEAIRYAIGRFGRPNVPIDPNVMDRIQSLPRTRELRAEPPMAPLDELRKQLGPSLSDEEFLLRADDAGGAGGCHACRGRGPAALRPDANR